MKYRSLKHLIVNLKNDILLNQEIVKLNFLLYKASQS
jgi:hypothetical protein